VPVRGGLPRTALTGNRSMRGCFPAAHFYRPAR